MSNDIGIPKNTIYARTDVQRKRVYVWIQVYEFNWTPSLKKEWEG